MPRPYHTIPCHTCSEPRKSLPAHSQEGSPVARYTRRVLSISSGRRGYAWRTMTRGKARRRHGCERKTRPILSIYTYFIYYISIYFAINGVSCRTQINNTIKRRQQCIQKKRERKTKGRRLEKNQESERKRRDTKKNHALHGLV